MKTVVVVVAALLLTIGLNMLVQALTPPPAPPPVLTEAQRADRHCRLAMALQRRYVGPTSGEEYTSCMHDQLFGGRS